MKTLIIASTVIVGGLFGSVAEAMPSTSIPLSEPVSFENVVRVDYACGRGFHENQWGHCRPNADRGPPRGYAGERYGWHRQPPPPPWAHRHHRRYYDDRW